jgi:hypothetical protein
MRVEWKTILGASLFLGVTCALYWFWSYEDAGSVMLLFGAAAYLLLFGYLLLQWIRRDGIPRPEDRVDATQADGAGEVGWFPAASIWPAGIGIGAVFVAIGLTFGTWYLVIGFPLIIGAIIGFLVESEAEDPPTQEHH